MSNSTLWSILIAAVIIGWLVYGVVKSGRDDTYYKSKGIRVEAKIVNKVNTGASGTGNMKFKMKLAFPTKDGLATASAERFFTPEELIKVMRNNTVLIYYVPSEPGKVYMVPGEME